MVKKSNIELHVHPFLEWNDFRNVVNAMDKTNIDVLGLESLNKSLYPKVKKEAEYFFPRSYFDNSGVRLDDSKIKNKFILNAREYSTKEDLHILTIGYSYDNAHPKTEIKEIIEKGLENDALVILDHPFADNGWTRTAGHVDEKLEDRVKELCKEYSGKIAMEWNGYSHPFIRYCLKQGLNAIGKKTEYHDINGKVEELSDKLKSEGYNVPVLVDTDLHARKKRHFNLMGTARIITELEGETPKEIVSSIKGNVFKGDYKNVKEYVPLMHIVEAFGVPILFPKYFPKPRA